MSTAKRQRGTKDKEIKKTKSPKMDFALVKIDFHFEDHLDAFEVI